jgi:intracellular septation protein
MATMDRRLLLEFLPGGVFLVTNLAFDLFAASAAAIAAAILCAVQRFRLDGVLPFLAVATVVLSATLLGAGFVFEDERYIKIRPTIGGVAFALVVIAGAGFRPPLLQRSLGYKLRLTDAGWRLLHRAWAGLALLFALANEIVWRNAPTDVWVAYSAAAGPLAFAAYYGLTRAIAEVCWIERDE